MRNLSKLDIKTDYRSGQDNSIVDFYNPCLSNSSKYFRSVGYFRSSIYLITGKAIIDFAKNEGEIRLICSPSITKEDSKAIVENTSFYEQNQLSKLNLEIEELLKKSEEIYEIRVLATLIKFGILKVKVAILVNADGIYHEKLGIFKDIYGNTVSFMGSANETLSAWHERGNFESIEVFCSWKETRENLRIERHSQNFEDLWNGVAIGVKTMDFPTAFKEKLITVAEKNIKEIDLEKLEKAKKSNKKTDNLLPHQIQAIENWKKNNCIGILQHATGSGKTVTALSAINSHISYGFPAIIFVPSQLLLTQWIVEIEQEIPDAIFLKVGAGNINWKKNNKLKNFISGRIENSKRIVVSTMQSGSTDEFLNAVNEVENLLIVIDEVHQVGSSENSKLLEIKAEKRMGLSATPERYGDELGTNKIINYFEKIIEPKISLFDAINSGRLVNYEYFPEIITLTEVESDKWKKISQEIKKEIAKASTGSESLVITNKAKLLIIERSRIAKKASKKIELAKMVIKKNYKRGESWLIYCEDIEQLNKVKESINDCGYETLTYYSIMDGSSEETLKLFQAKGGILISVRCLDEGIDIPTISHALILSSSQNPRQFIQRRGRVLRKHESKIFAKIYDAMVVPNSIEDEPEQYSLLKSELVRAYEFSQNAINLSSGEKIKIAIKKLGLDMDDILEITVEEE